MIRLYEVHEHEEDQFVEIPMEISNFPDGSLHLKINFNPYGIDPDAIMVDWRYENDAELFTLISIKDKIDEDWFQMYTVLNMPYVPHARMDRVKNDEDCFTLKTFARILNSLKFDRVNVLDAHSNVSLALIDNIVAREMSDYPMTATHDIAEIEYGSRFGDKYEESMNNLVIFYPDEGAMKRYSGMMQHPYAFGIKDRDWNTGKIKSLKIVNEELVKGKNILIIDDICSRGGTFLRAAEALKDAGAKNVYLYVTHAEKTMYEGEMYRTPDLVKHIFTTDSLPNYHPNFSADKVSIYTYF